MNKLMWMYILILLSLCTNLNSKTVFLSSFRGNDDFLGFDPINSFKTFSKAYNQIQSGDTIYCEGKFTWSSLSEINYVSKKGIVIDKSIYIIGANPSQKTIFESDSIPNGFESCIFTINKYIQLHLKNICIQNGYLHNCGNRGAGIYMYDYASIYVDSCNFIQNHIWADNLNAVGGGIYANLYNNITINHCYFYENTAENTGVGNSTTIGNSGALFSMYGVVKIENSTFHKNKCQYFGGAIYTIAASFQLENCTFYENIGGSNILQIRYPTKFSYLINNSCVKNLILNKNIDTGIITCNGNDTHGKKISLRNNLLVDNLCMADNEKTGIRYANMIFLDEGANYIDTLYLATTDSILSLIKGNVLVNDLNLLQLDNKLSTKNDFSVPVLKFNPSSKLSDSGFSNSILNYYTNSDTLVLQKYDASGTYRDEIVDVGAFENTEKRWEGKYNSIWNNKLNWIGGFASGNDVNYVISPIFYAPEFNQTISCNSITLQGEQEIHLKKMDSLIVRKDLIMNFDRKMNFKTDGIINLTPTSSIITEIELYPNNWKFISFPYNIVEIQKYDQNQWIKVVWGNPSTPEIKADIYVAKYDNFRRAYLNTSTGNWKDLDEEVLQANCGYIIAVDDTSEFRFISDKGEKLIVSDTISLNKFNYTYDADYFNQSWNFFGNPYLCKIDLKSVLPFHAPLYFFDGENYHTSAFCDEKILDPLEAFMFQNYSDENLQYIKNYPDLNKTPVNDISNSTQLILKIKDFKNRYEDNTRIYFSIDANEEFEIGKDAYKLFGTSLLNAQIYTSLKGVDFSFNFLPFNLLPIPLKIKNFKNKTLELTQKGTLLNHVWLLNSSFQIIADLSLETFNNYNSDELFEGYIGFSNTTDNREIECLNYHQLNEILKNKSLNGSFEMVIYDLTGKQILKLINSNRIFEHWNWQKGIYLLHISSNNKSEFFKILL